MDGLNDFLLRLRLWFRTGLWRLRLHRRIHDALDPADGIILVLPDRRHQTIQQGQRLVRSNLLLLLGKVVVCRVGDISGGEIITCQRMDFFHTLTDDLQQLLTLGIQHLAMG